MPPEANPQVNLQVPPPPKSNLKTILFIVIAVIIIFVAAAEIYFLAVFYSAKQKVESDPKGALREVIGDDKVGEIENEESDRKAESNVRETANAVMVCITLLKADNKTGEKALIFELDKYGKIKINKT